MEHNWFLDDSYIRQKEHYVRELCTKCLAEKYLWVRLVNGEVHRNWYILDGNTQYGFDHKCSGELIKYNGFHLDTIIIDEAIQSELWKK